MTDNSCYSDHQHQKIMRQRDAIDEMKLQLARYRAALLLISEWKSPYTGFEGEWGSNGIRDYFREIAKQALT